MREIQLFYYLLANNRTSPNVLGRIKKLTRFKLPAQGYPRLVLLMEPFLYWPSLQFKLKQTEAILLFVHVFSLLFIFIYKVSTSWRSIWESTALQIWETKSSLVCKCASSCPTPQTNASFRHPDPTSMSLPDLFHHHLFVQQVFFFYIFSWCLVVFLSRGVFLPELINKSETWLVLKIWLQSVAKILQPASNTTRFC